MSLAQGPRRQRLFAMKANAQHSIDTIPMDSRPGDPILYDAGAAREV